jgi:hypothetical protein
MTKKEALRQAEQKNTLMALGFTRDEAEQLRRISMTLQRWFELECGNSNDYKSWSIERDENTDIPYMVEHMHVVARPGGSLYSNSNTYRTRVPDRETGARKRLDKIIKARNERQTPICANYYGVATTYQVGAYIQGDPRGAALYILRPGDVPEGKSADSYYNRGICVY